MFVLDSQKTRGTDLCLGFTENLEGKVGVSVSVFLFTENFVYSMWNFVYSMWMSFGVFWFAGNTGGRCWVVCACMCVCVVYRKHGRKMCVWGL